MVKVLTAGGASLSKGIPQELSPKNESSIFDELSDDTKKEFINDSHAFSTEDESCVRDHEYLESRKISENNTAYTDDPYATVSSGGPFPSEPLEQTSEESPTFPLVWLAICFFGIMVSFVAYGLLLEYATSGGRELHELSFLFVTSLLYTLTAAAGRYVRAETPTTIPPARFAILGMTSMSSTYCSVRSLRYVIYPIQVLAKSCKPVPVMLMGSVLGKKYPLKKYINVLLIVAGVGLFMGGGTENKNHSSVEEIDTSSQLIGIILLFISLCFDGGTGAYEDKLMAVYSVGPFDLMYNIQLGKTIIAGIGLVIFNQIHLFMQMCQEMGFVLIALGLTGAMGQVFIFVTISKFGALTCSIIGLARKVTTLIASIYFYGHLLNSVQCTGLVISVGAMVMNFMGKKKGGEAHGDTPATPQAKDAAKGNDVEFSSYKDNVDCVEASIGTSVEITQRK